MNQPASIVGQPAASYARFSSDLQSESSLADQQRECRQRATRDGADLRPEMEFSDAAVSGTKRDRLGLDAMLQSAAQGAFKVLYLYSLSRLARESVITMPLLKDLVHNRGVRVISIQDGIDTLQENWTLLASIISVQHENYIKDLGNSVRRGQTGNVLGGRFSVGDQCFGYTSVPVEGSQAGRRGRNAKPRKEYRIDDAVSPWVARIFDWFVNDKMGFTKIARNLTEQGAPKDHRSTKPGWHPSYVRRVLTNTKYVGRWPWGKKINRRNPLTGDVRQEDRDEHERKDWVREMPHLRIVSDELFEAAQRRVAEIGVSGGLRKKGRLTGSPPGGWADHPRHLLAGLLFCRCGARFHTAGANARYLHCSGRLKGTCDIKVMVSRERAERMIVEAVGRQVLADPVWTAALHEELRTACTEMDKTLPAELRRVEIELAAAENRIGRLLNALEDGAADGDIRQLLTKRQGERDRLKVRLTELEHLRKGNLPPPDEAWVRGKLAELGELLGGDGPAAALALRNLVGGRVEVEEVVGAGRVRGFPRLSFAVQSTDVVKHLGGRPVPSESDHSMPISIDLHEPARHELLADRAKALFDEGRKCREIADGLGCGRTLTTRALAHWFSSRGLPVPDLRSLRCRLPSHSKATELADRVMAMWDGGSKLQVIAAELGCDRNTVTAALKHWHAERGIPAPDGRSRNPGRFRPGGEAGT